MAHLRSSPLPLPDLMIAIVGGIALGIGSIAPSRSQIIPDGSLGTRVDASAIETLGTLSIEAGTVSGTNVFHSFQDFSIPSGVTAEFEAIAGIERIFSRVTGASRSHIDGTLRSPVSLFFINPNGIIFSETAAIDVTGSFYATTADRLEFADGLSFRTTLNDAPPLLSLSVPTGLGFGTIAGQPDLNTGTIINRSQTIGIGLDGNPAPVGLNATPTQTLGLIGGNVTFENGIATAIDGQIAAIALQDGLWSLDTGDVGEGAIGGSVTLAGGVINTSGLSGGLVQLLGADIGLTNGFGVYTDTLGEFAGGGIVARGDRLAMFGESFLSASNFGIGSNAGITFNFNESIAIDGIGPYVTVGKLLSGTLGLSDRLGGLYALVGGTGAGGDITLTAPLISLTNGASVFTTVIGFGSGGDITLQATDTLLAAGGTFVLTSTVAPGPAGDLQIEAGTLLSVAGGVFNTSPSGEFSGDGGDFDIRADRIEVRDVPAGVPIPGSILATTLGSGDAGNLTIETQSLLLSGGGQVTVSSSGAGRGGNLRLNADTIEIDGATPDGRFLSGIYASSGLLTVDGTRGDASAGSIDITARQLSIRDGGQISAAIGNAGSAGDVRLNISEFIDLSGLGTNIDPSVEAVSFGIIGDGIIPTAIEANTSSSGNAGNISIATDQLYIRDGAEIGVRGTSTGNAGDLAIMAREIELANTGNITVATASGQEGNVTLNGERLVIRDRASITATAANNGDGGNLNLSLTEAIIGLNQSTILADANTGNGGQIVIETPGLFLSADSRVSASSNLGQSGTIAIRSPNLNPGASLVNLTTDTATPDAVILDACRTPNDNRFTINSRGGLALTPMDAQNLTYPLYLRALPHPQTRTSIAPSTHVATIPSESTIQEARRFQQNVNGTVELTLAPRRVDAALQADNLICAIEPSHETN